MAEKDPHKDIAALAFDAALKELETIVGKLERGDAPLEDSIAIYARGEALKRHCEALLRKAESRIEAIRLGPEGKPDALRPLDPES